MMQWTGRKAHPGVRLTSMVLSCLFLVVLPVQGQTWTGKVVAVHDGDTIGMLIDGKEHRIRLHGIDCPETNQAYGTRAKEFTAGLVFGKIVTAIRTSTDQYGRPVCDVFLRNGLSLNQELVRNGLAWLYKKFSDDATLKRLEIRARRNHRGLWADPNPVPPWKFRSEDKTTGPRRRTNP